MKIEALAMGGVKSPFSSVARVVPAPQLTWPHNELHPPDAEMVHPIVKPPAPTNHQARIILQT